MFKDFVVKDNGPPNYHLLPDAVVQAELLVGSLVKCGPGVRGVGWPDTPRVRAASTRHRNPHNLVLVLTTAAFVWGHSWPKNNLLQLSTLSSKRHLEPPGLNTIVHEFNIQTSEVVVLNEVTVTSPIRTVYDLLYLNDGEYAQSGRSACIFLMLHTSVKIKDLQKKLAANRRPYRNRAYSRLQSFVK